MRTLRSTVPARLDRLPWSRFHWLVISSLGIAWILDGLEITMIAGIADTLQRRETLNLTASLVGLTASVYLLGEVVGALVFARLADRWGRRRLFIVTIVLYLVASGLAGLAWDFASFAVLRFVAGMGIGGEYGAINSAIDELIPARYRGRADIAVNGTYWFGAMLAAAAQIVLLDPDRLPVDVGWRAGLFLGPLIGLMVWRLRRYVPESPRWLIVHGRADEAERILTGIERNIESRGSALERVGDESAIEIVPQAPVGYMQIARSLFGTYPTRSLLGAAIMITQSFLYNAIFFTSGLILGTFYGVANEAVGYFLFPFALGNLAGALLLGVLFDTKGRRAMISGTYLLSAALLAISGCLFYAGALNALTQTMLWCVIFFFASAGASSGYLTVSEIFPIEFRAQAIAFFFAIAQFFGGVVAPALFGRLVEASNDGANPL
ncbi:MAG TPA: MFS transporter, partial [Gammaproteobacteria bacterium]|nr:MFS transporter [Gammaproteobacteria bacterium]